MAVAVKLPDNAGIALGAAIPLPGGLTQPLTVWVTVYVPGVMTVMDAVVAPLLQSNVPVVPVAVITELPQLLATPTPGAATEELTGVAVPLPAALTQPLMVWVTV